MQRYFLKLSYNGSAYNGWQIQKNAPVTVQAVLEENLSKVLREKIYLVGCGRTDTGVHATEFYAHFYTGNTDIAADPATTLHKFNMVIPHDIAIHAIIPVEHKAHARFDAAARTYKYYIHKKKDPFFYNRSCLYHFELDINKMNDACKVLFEYDDFTSFSKSRTQTNTNLCNIMFAGWTQEGEQLVFTIKANRFLRNMVRAIVGTMLKIGRSEITNDDMRKVIEAKQRAEAGVSVPANGLYLVKVDYPDGFFEMK